MLLIRQHPLRRANDEAMREQGRELLRQRAAKNETKEEDVEAGPVDEKVDDEKPQEQDLERVGTATSVIAHEELPYIHQR